MADIQVADRADLLITLLKEHGNRGDWTQDAQALTDYPAFRMFIEQGRYKKQAGGEQISRRYQYRLDSAARDGALYEQTTPSKRNVHTRWLVPWHHFTYDGPMIDRRELLMHTSTEQLVDEALRIRNDARIAMIELLEESIWGTGTGPSDNKLWGIPHFITKSASAAFGFNGQNPSGYSNTANIDRSSSTYQNARNGTFTFSAVDGTFFDKIRTACKKTNFRAPVGNPSPGSLNPQSEVTHAFFMDEETHSGIEKYLQKLNDQMGSDALPYYGEGMVRRAPCMYVPQLDGDPTFYGLHLDTWEVVCLQGDDMHVEAMKLLDGQRTTLAGITTHTMAMVCNRPRSNFVGDKV